MTLLCALLVVIAVVLAVPPPAGRTLARRLDAAEAAPDRHRGRLARWSIGSLIVASVLAGGALVAGPAGGVAAAAATIAGSTGWHLFRLRRQSRRAAGARAEVAHACRVLAGQLRVGRIPADAVRVTATDCPVLATAAALLDLGGDPVAHWRERSGRPGQAGLLVLARAWSVSTRTGAPLAPALERVAAALATDLAVERLVAGEIASARATGKIMAALPVCGIGLGYLIGGRPLQFLVAGPVGWGCLLAGVSAAAIGVLWIDRLARTAADVPMER